MLAKLLFSRSVRAATLSRHQITRENNKILALQISNAYFTKITAFQSGHVVLISYLGDITLNDQAIPAITKSYG
jgi:hypothetical protein